MKYLLLFIVLLCNNSCRHSTNSFDKKPSLKDKWNDFEPRRIKGKVKSISACVLLSLSKNNRNEGRGYCETYYYNKNGNLTLWMRKFNDEQKAYQNIIEYDTLKGEYKVKETRYYPEGMLESINIYHCDKYGKVVTFDNFNYKGKLMSKNFYTYDSLGRNNGYEMIQTSDGLLELKRKSQFDSNGLVIKDSLWSVMENFDGITEYKYNSDLDCVREANFNIKGKATIIITHKYENYDEYGNWLRMSSSNNEGKTGIVTNTITYY